MFSELQQQLMAGRKMRIALVQMAVGKDKAKNLEKAQSFIQQAKANGSSLVVLPECFNSPYGLKYFGEYAESIPDGETSKALSDAAKDSKVFLVGGTHPENDQGELFNTCTVWDPKGKLVCKHRKIHLFDIDIAGGIKFKESEVLKAGSSLTTFNINEWKIGLGICYDIRFSEMAQLYGKAGCKLLVYPAAFNMTTGPLHWELLQRSRAVDNELYVATVSPAQDKTADYVAYGHSTVVDPWGRITSTSNFNETLIYADIDINTVDEMRKQIPIYSQRRYDIFETILKK